MELSETALTIYSIAFTGVVALLVGACVAAILRRRHPDPEQPAWTVDLAWSAVPLAVVIGLWISVVALPS